MVDMPLNKETETIIPLHIMAAVCVNFIEIILPRFQYFKEKIFLPGKKRNQLLPISKADVYV